MNHVRLASGGSNSHTSISDPLFKQFKDKQPVESKVYSKFGDKYIVDIDDVSGGARAIPRASHNKYQPTSKQPGFTIDMGDDLNAFIKKLNGNGNIDESMETDLLMVNLYLLLLVNTQAKHCEQM